MKKTMQLSLKRSMLVLLLGAATLGALTACAPVILGGMVVGGMAAVDRRTSGAQVEDKTIEIKGSSRLGDALGDVAHINITSYNRKVLLTGEVASEADKQKAQRIAEGIENVRSVVNELAILGISTLTQRSSDVLVTTRAKGALLDDKSIDGLAFKIVTERGTVYMLGRVTEREANRATEIIRATNGVQRVVKVLELITEQELAAILPAPPPTEASAPKVGN